MMCVYVYVWCVWTWGGGFSSCMLAPLDSPKTGAVRNPPTDSFHGDDNSSQTSMCERRHTLSLLSIKASHGRAGPTDVGRKWVQRTNRGWFKDSSCKFNLSASPCNMCVTCVCVCVLLYICTCIGTLSIEFEYGISLCRTHFTFFMTSAFGG